MTLSAMNILTILILAFIATVPLVVLIDSAKYLIRVFPLP